MCIMDIKTLAEQYNDYIIDRRRYYHTCPELSGEEKNTRAHLKEDLEALGITDIHELETCYGLTATIHGGKPGKTVALRADIDALPVKEETGLPFASHNEGKMHACGHDNHMAMLLGAAKILNEVKDELSGDVRLVFQPAEETAVGALRMMEEHALDGVDAIYGVHVWGTYDAPGIAFPAGNLMACCIPKRMPSFSSKGAFTPLFVFTSNTPLAALFPYIAAEAASFNKLTDSIS